MSGNGRNESESSLSQPLDTQLPETTTSQKYCEFNFNGDDSDCGPQSIKSEPRRDIVSPPPQEVKKHKIFLSKNNPANNTSGSVTNARFNAALTIPGHNPLPISNTQKFGKKFNAVNNNAAKLQQSSQQSVIIQGSHATSTTPTPVATPTVNNNANNSSNSSNGATVAAAANASKNRRHDTYNKNIYIGTKNAQKWEMLRMKMQCKNDVEFVTHLLNLMEKYTAFKKQEALPTNSSTSSR